ncbi:elongation factor P [Natranaerobius thermophilus]|uniref:Elongation factor P n=1 Tax=Natranaerobius thermophilus (strain ATCC BAA-1301 / DSM 18059 / JW/NM-WN-LF) TaxID=457570 RepID=EFP_NATTJ|nr:elongation factor P [Natranaerobius thermophilus]B2A549.1 RecName: Full=Elongation factor P; Short=EF-P [Natranaerobius thermophilus JW/NM-WN-LF]ACB85291.1 translation elongation factor P (EF-P) [Natranaerobius thermophilus JW/NM-WN-LF]
MITSNDFKNGMTIEVDGEVYSIVEFQHVKPGKGAAFVRTKLRHMKSGNVSEKTFRAGEKVKRAHLEEREMQFLYAAGDMYNFMDTESFEQYTLTKDQLEDKTQFIKENMIITVLFHNGEEISIELPVFVELAVSETEPGVKGDTASGGSKPATLETGATVNVPFFINEGDIIKVDTRTSEYIERVKGE